MGALLFDALHIADGLLMTIKLPLRLQPGYHRSWAVAAPIDRAAVC